MWGGCALDGDVFGVALLGGEVRCTVCGRGVRCCWMAARGCLTVRRCARRLHVFCGGAVGGDVGVCGGGGRVSLVTCGRGHCEVCVWSVDVERGAVRLGHRVVWVFRRRAFGCAAVVWSGGSFVCGG